MSAAPDGFEREAVNAFADRAGPFYRSGEILGLRIEPHHLNTFGKAQGGLLMTMVDLAMGSAVRRAAGDDEVSAATVSLTPVARRPTSRARPRALTRMTPASARQPPRIAIPAGVSPNQTQAIRKVRAGTR